MKRHFNFSTETTAATDFAFASEMQAAKSAALGAVRILKTGYKTSLPQYILDAAKAAGLKAKNIGRTTGKSSTWAFYKTA